MLLLRSLALLLLTARGAALVLPTAGTSVGVSRAASISMAHHVQKKATKHHAHTRPRKSRPSDINRVPAIQPTVPDGPWYEQTSGLTGPGKKTVTVTVTPEDTADSIAAKVTAAGANAPDAIEFGGQVVTGTLADCGLEAEASLEAVVIG